MSQREGGRRRRKFNKFKSPSIKKSLSPSIKASNAEEGADVHEANQDEDQEDENDEEADVDEHDEKRQLMSQREGGRRRRKFNKFKSPSIKKSLSSSIKASNAEEGADVHDKHRQLLSQREGGRRRRKNWFKKAVKTVAKVVTCFTKNVAKTCNVPKSCNMGESFNDCFSEVR